MPSSRQPSADRAGPPASRPVGRRVTDRVSSLCTRYQLTAFFAVTFLWTWGYVVVLYLFVTRSPGILSGIPFAWGPLIGAAVVTWLGEGDLRGWVGKVADWRIRPRWYTVAILLPIVVHEWGAGVYVAAGVAVGTFPYDPPLYLLNFVAVLFLAGSLEEFGWRGFAQPRLQERYSALTAAVVIGVIWAGWHLPWFALRPQTYSGFQGYLVATVGFSIVLAWLYNSTGGSLIPVMLMHAAHDIPNFFEPMGSLPASVNAVVEPLFSFSWIGLGLLLTVFYGRRYLADGPPTPRIPGWQQTGGG